MPTLNERKFCTCIECITNGIGLIGLKKYMSDKKVFFWNCRWRNPKTIFDHCIGYFGQLRTILNNLGPPRPFFIQCPRYPNGQNSCYRFLDHKFKVFFSGTPVVHQILSTGRTRIFLCTTFFSLSRVLSLKEMHWVVMTTQRISFRDVNDSLSDRNTQWN